MTLSRPPLSILSSCFSTSPWLPLFFLLSISSSLPFVSCSWSPITAQKSRQDCGLNKHSRGHVITQQPPVLVSQSVPQCWGPLNNTFLLLPTVQPTSQAAKPPKEKHRAWNCDSQPWYRISPPPVSPVQQLVSWKQTRAEGVWVVEGEGGARWNRRGLDSSSSKASLFASAVLCTVLQCLHEAVFVWWGKYALQKNKFWHNAGYLIMTSVHMLMVPVCRRWKGAVEVGGFLSPAVRDWWHVRQRNAHFRLAVLLVYWELLSYQWITPSAKRLSCQCNC